MGKTITPTYRLEMYERGHRSSMAWRGKPSNKALAKWIHKYIQSLKVGGVNQHLSLSKGYMPIPNRAHILRQRTGEVVAFWQAPKFMKI